MEVTAPDIKYNKTSELIYCTVYDPCCKSQRERCPNPYFINQVFLNQIHGSIGITTESELYKAALGELYIFMF